MTQVHETTADQSAGDLVKLVTEQASVLIRDELKLAQLEMTRKGKQAGLGVGMFGGSALVALFGVGCLTACAVIGLSHVVTAWLAALIIGVALFAVAGISALLGKSRLQKATPVVPRQAVDGIKTDVETIKEGIRRS